MKAKMRYDKNLVIPHFFQINNSLKAFLSKLRLKKLTRNFRKISFIVAASNYYYNLFLTSITAAIKNSPQPDRPLYFHATDYVGHWHHRIFYLLLYWFDLIRH